MGKKIWYSRPLSYMWEQYNNFFRQKKGTPDDFYKDMVNLISKDPFISKEKKIVNLSALDLWRVEVHKKFTHIFFTTGELRDFLQEMPLVDLDGIIDFLFKSGEAFFYIPSAVSVQQVQTYSFGIHIPYEKESKGYAFQLSLAPTGRINLLWSQNENYAICSSATYKENCKKEDEKSQYQAKMFRLAVNTIAYMQAFPECVKEGAPQTSFTENSFILSPSDKIIEQKTYAKTGRVMPPHYRRGYLKMLTSDFYKEENRGKIIFVTDTTVNAESKTVEKSKDQTKLNTFKAGRI